MTRSEIGPYFGHEDHFPRRAAETAAMPLPRAATTWDGVGGCLGEGRLPADGFGGFPEAGGQLGGPSVL
ncbi:hypothetical protein AQJ91_43640 [Streptomyces dysideae]|uniref:Uncharacterized protein n=1 Tax=Streptomyces dysideae TaxID=909626 RepID=A0A124IDG0_9ACTN|nr:hypothetical protein AQJ91_43640 [Streptomyces dysideae]